MLNLLAFLIYRLGPYGLCVLFLCGLLPSPAYAEIPTQFPKGSLQIQAQTSYLKTDSNYNKSGSNASLLNGAGYKELSNQALVRYAYTQKLWVFTTLDLNFAESESSLETKQILALTNLLLGLNYDFGKFGVRWIFESSYSQALKTYDIGSTDPLPGDGVNRFDVGMHAIQRLGDFEFRGYLGYAARMSGFSQLLNYKVAFHFLYEDLVFGFGLKGIQTIQNDKDSSNRTARDLFLANNNGGSFYHASIDPSATSVYGSFYFPIHERLTLYTQIEKSIRGENYANYMAGTIGLEFLFKNRVRTQKELRTNEFEFEDTPVSNDMDEEIRNYNSRPKIQTERSIRLQPSANKLKQSQKRLGKEPKIKVQKLKPGQKKKRVKIDL